ncbi:MAG: SEC-C metal-binding domain-containing protein [Chitinophagaceae bacterium]
MAKIGRNESCPCGSGIKYKKCCASRQDVRKGKAVPRPRHVIHRRNYRLRRYLEYLSREELEQRAMDVFTNLHVLNEELKYSLPSIKNTGGTYWMVLWTHVLEEFEIRYGQYPAGFTNGFIKGSAIPEYDFKIMKRAADVANKMKSRKGGLLFKFGQSKYLRPMLENGSIRIMPASSYNDPSMNQAIRDEELQVSFLRHPSEIVIEAIDELTGEPTGLIQPDGNLTVTLEAPTNYYVWCLASTYSLRLYGDFEADACLVIRHPKEFIGKLIQEFEKKMLGWKGKRADIHYFDPLNGNRDVLDVFFSKHFRYAYQKEFRVIWLPPTPATTLEPIYLELGSLDKYCELVSLRDMLSA